MATEEKTTRPVVPYLPWITFTGFVGELAKKGTPPPQIDSSILASKSGTDARMLRQTLDFFGLTSGEGREVTELFRRLIASHGTDAWAQEVKHLVTSYSTVIGILNLASATQRQLEDAMEGGGLKGAAPKDKAARFFIALAKEAGVPISPHFKQLRPGAAGRKVGGSKGNGKKLKGGAVDEQPPAQNASGFVPPANTSIIKPLPDSDFTVCLPEAMTEEEMFFVLTHFMNYLKLRKGWFRNSSLEFGAPST